MYAYFRSTQYLRLGFGRAAVRLLVGPRRWSALLSPLSIAAVFALNFALTGDAQFSSVAEKGYFRVYPFVMAALMTAIDLLGMVGTYLFAVPLPLSRLFSVPSPVTAVTFWIGLVALSRRFREWNSSALILAAATAVGAVSVASGGFSGIDFDRYLAWMMPLVFLVSAYGLELLASKIRSPFWRKLPIVALVVLTLFSTVSMVMMMRSVSEGRMEELSELREEARLLPADATVGSEDFIWAYGLPPTIRYREISGVFTPKRRTLATRLRCPSRLAAVRWAHSRFRCSPRPSPISSSTFPAIASARSPFRRRPRGRNENARPRLLTLRVF